MRHSPRLLLVLVPAIVFSACSTNPTQPQTSPGSDPAAALTELAEVYKYRAVQQQPAPAKLEDLAEQQNALETAWPLIQDGSIIVIWRAGYAANGTEVLAYEKVTPSQGGKVLLRNGTIKQVTAEEFKSMPKAR